MHKKNFLSYTPQFKYLYHANIAVTLIDQDSYFYYGPQRET